MRTSVTASKTFTVPPEWAVLERALFADLDVAWRAFAARYTEGDGRLVFHDRLGVIPDDRDGVDDFYEPFFNWPTLYLLGGADDLLPAAKQHWAGVTAQLTELGMMRDEYDRGYDWFHQGEGLLLFYGLCLADPDDAAFSARAERFAGLYLGGAPGNYDAAANIIRAPHTGADGPRPGFSDGEPYFPWSPSHRHYGLPLDWIEGIDSFDQVADDPQTARRMGREMFDRMGRGDTAINLGATSLMLNAYLMTGDQRYRDWVLTYADGWLARTAANDGVMPDNTGLSGMIGEYFEGRWYGALYGWAWPHGLHSVGGSATIAALNASLVGGPDYLKLGRSPLDAVLRQGRPMPLGFSPTPGSRWHLQFAGHETEPTLLVPWRHADAGWHDFLPMPSSLPTALWQHSGDKVDAERLQLLRERASYDWRSVHAFRDKEEAGHEEPWLTFLAGDNPTYPQQILRVAREMSTLRLTQMAADDIDPVVGPTTADIHHWQNRNPVLTEALLQLTCGAPQVLYNGGLLQTRLRYHDAERRRPGLPADVAALVESIDVHDTVVNLVNLSANATRTVVVQAGTFAEHRIDTIQADGRPTASDGRYVSVELGPRTQLQLRLGLTAGAHTPSYRQPWN